MTTANILTTTHYRLEHNYNETKNKHLMISMEYADDITEITSNHAHVEEIKSNLPIKLKSRNLIVNTEKTEEYTVNRNSNDWKKWGGWAGAPTFLQTKQNIYKQNIFLVNCTMEHTGIFIKSLNRG